MLSLSPVKNAAQASHYFAQDNYYTSEQSSEMSQWHGKAAADLELKGSVDPAKFFELLEGKVDGQQVGRSAAEADGEGKFHRPGTDLTFSAPKSVSILAEVEGLIEVRQAHETATQRALNYVESNLLSARVTKDGVTDKVYTDEAIFALFRHNTSRNLDPQTHTHAILMNLGQTDDGKWRAIVNDLIFQERKTIGAIYNNELARELRSLGYELTEPDKRGNFEIHGVSREAIEAFSTRRKEVTDWLKEKGIDPEFATQKQSEAAALSTRASKQQVDHEKLLGAWKDQSAALGGITIEKVARESPGAKEHISGASALKFSANHHFEREMVTGKSDLIQTALNHSQGRASSSSILKALDGMEKAGELVDVGSNKVSAAKGLASERWSIRTVSEGKGQVASILTPEEVEVRLTKEHAGGRFGFTKGQKEAITLSLTTQDRFIAVQGLAGTGKTTMLKKLNGMAVDEGMVVRAMAPTGAAAKQLTKETGMDADTVTMFELKERAFAKDIDFVQRHSKDFVRPKELWIVDESSFLSQKQITQLERMAINAGSRVVLLGDSAQLQGVDAGKPFEIAQRDGISTATMNQINRQKTDELRAFVGDLTQGEMLENRYARPSSIEMHGHAKAFERLDKTGHVHEIANEKIIDAVVSHVRDIEAQSGLRALIITPYNKDRQELNVAIRSSLKQSGGIEREEQILPALETKGWTDAKRKEAQYYHPGDVVRFGRDYPGINIKKGQYATIESVTRHDRRVQIKTDEGVLMAWQPHRNSKIEVYDAVARPVAVGEQIRITRNGPTLKNGETATVTANVGGVLSLKLIGGDMQSLDTKANPHWDYGYASTVHAAQGATAESAIFVLRTKDRSDHSEVAAMSQAELNQVSRVVGARSFYVAGTRATHHFSMFVTNKVAAQQIVSQQQTKTSAVEELKEIGIREKPINMPREPKPRGYER